MASALRPPLPLVRCVTLALCALLGGAASAGAEEAADLGEAREHTRQGAQALATADPDAAREHFEAALALAPSSAAARRNLALGLSRLAGRALGRRDGTAALDLLDRALELHPGRLHYAVLRGQALRLQGRLGEALRVAQEAVARSPEYVEAWLLLTDVQERAGELAEARRALERALVLRPGDEALRGRWGVLDRRAQAEGRFLAHGTGNFEVRYSPDADPETVRLALTLLEDAYARVTADLGLAPRTPARIVLYDGDEFQRVTRARLWVGALYANGTLRVPIRNLERHRASAARVLAHEFTHHVLRERVPGLPTWWHEGIAQFEEDDGDEALARRRAVNARLAPLAAQGTLLDRTRMRETIITAQRDPAVVNLYYGQALSFVAWLVEEVGPGALPAFLLALGTGRDVDAAARRAFGRDLDALLADWRGSL